MMSLSDFSEGLKILLQLANVVIIGYGLYKYFNKPHDALEQRHEELKKRVDEHDVKIKEVTESLHQGNDRFRNQEANMHKLNTTFKSVMLAFVNFEIAYCMNTDYKHTEELVKAKEELEKYLKE